MNRYKVVIAAANKVITVDKGTRLKAVLADLMDFPCGGRGTCGKCQVLIDNEVQLACLAKVNHDIKVDLLRQVSTKKPLRHRKLTTSVSCGLAIDIGTTVVAAALIDLTTGKEIASFKQKNNQRKYGEDVISRISYSLEKPENLLELQNLVIANINNLIKDIDKDFISSVVVAGNTVMEHLFLGKDTKPLASLPFTPTFKGGTYVKAGELGININPQTEIYVVPNLAGFVGGDITAGIIKSGLFNKDQGYYMLIDIGTNGEIVIGNKDQIYCASAAAGPALEGMGITYGMLAQEGAICEVASKVKFKTIGNVAPIGICGSGIIDLMAILLENNIIDESGKLSEPVTITKDITFTQKDVRQVQLAKSAIFTAITLLMQAAEIDKSEIKEIYIAGEFGKNINIKNAIKIGLIPKFPLTKIKYLGNTSLQGAVAILLNKNYIKTAESLASRCKHIELANKKQFQDVFADNLFFSASL